MILDVDIGNSRIKWRITGANGSADKYAGVAAVGDLREALNGIRRHPVRRVRASSVAGDGAQRELAAITADWFGLSPEFAGVEQGLGGVKLCYPEPQRFGVDRWLAMLAAYRKYQRSCVVVDAGSALTADFLMHDGTHVGGLILPGVRLMQGALFSHTHAVKVDALTLPQKWQPGCDTLSCVENGVAAAVSGLIQELIGRGRQYCRDDPAFVVSGGDAPAIAGYDSRLLVEPDLVLDGLAIALPDPSDSQFSNS